MSVTLWILFLALFATATLCAKFPSELEKCNYGDTECIKAQMNKATKVFLNGSSKLNLIPLEPVSIDGFEIVQGGSGPINLDITFKNAKVYGVSGANVVKVKGFSKNPDRVAHEIHYTVPRVSMVGDYKAKGQILVLPIAGKGKANLTMDNADVAFYFTTRAVERNGEMYMEIVNGTFDYKTISKLYMQFDDLFSGDQQLTNNINSFLNENWKVIFEELKAKVGEVFGEISKQMINNVFAKRPYKDYFKEE